MRVLGIDCGSQVTGFGIVESDGRVHRLLSAGGILVSAYPTLADRILAIYDRLGSLMEEFIPNHIAVESVFHAINAQSALKLAHVRGVVLLRAAQAGLQIGEYSPLEVKQSVVGHGRATKEQVQMMVTSLLRLPEAPQPHDAADAAAVAICHATRWGGRIRETPRKTHDAKVG